MSTDDRGETLSPNVYKKILGVLGDDYQYATQVVTYSEVQGCEFDYIGMAEFRDALTHVKRAIFTNDESVAFDELNSASEHIRRAAVESMQEYVEGKYASIKRRLYLNVRNREYISELEGKIRENIIQGRSVKPFKKWKEAIGYFKEAETLLNQLDEEVPLIDIRVNRFKLLIYLLIAGITGYLIATL
jgi:tetratricopeptide (TPR) repeat protein